VDSSGADTSGSEWQQRTGNTFDNAVLYCGYRYDPETGLYHVRYRPYHATLGRWLTRDPAGYVDGRSLYEYCLSTPVAAFDPSGLLLEAGWSTWTDEDWVEHWKNATPAQIWNDLDSMAIAAMTTQMQMPAAGLMMRRFLEKKGGWVQLPWDWLMQSAGARAAARKAKKQVHYEVTYFVGEILSLGKLGWDNKIYEADSFQRGSGLSWWGFPKRGKDHPDVFYAMGSFWVRDYPWIRAKYNDDCTVTVRVKHRLRVDDMYDWTDPKKSVHVPVKLPNPLGHGPTEGTMFIPDWVPEKVRRAGLAKTFEIRIRHDEWEEMTMDEEEFIEIYEEGYDFEAWNKQENAQQESEQKHDDGEGR
jgi:RHS repeat-associated protein